MAEELCSYCGGTLEKCNCSLERRGETAEQFELKLRQAPKRIRETVNKQRF